MSLVSLAIQKQLPPHQFMDVETLEWIKQNKPFKVGISTLDNTILRESVRQARNFIPCSDWFLDKIEINTIHGLRHLIRVSVYSSILYSLNKINVFRVEPLLIASSLHDIRRQNDNADVGHATRASKWFIQNKDEVMNFYKCRLESEEISFVSAALLLHEMPYSELLNDKFYKSNSLPIDILKTADALDRYVQPKLKWWINDEYLRLIPNDQLKLFAYNLILQSEERFLFGENSIDSIFNVLE